MQSPKPSLVKGLPKFLYRYERLPLPEEKTPIYSIENLRAHAVYFKKPAELDDPFDCALAIERKEPSDDEALRYFHSIYERQNEATRDTLDQKYLDEHHNPNVTAIKAMIRRTGKEFYEKYRQIMLTQRGVVCFSETYESISMWAHYANGHRGFCLEFDTSCPLFERVMPIDYPSDDRIPSFTLVEILEDAEKALTPMIASKAKCWEYQKEWRVFVPQGGILHPYDVKYLTGIHFGCKLSDKHKNEIWQILSDWPTECYDMEKSEDKFRLVRKKLFSAH